MVTEDRGRDLCALERSAIDSATFDGAHWTVSPNVPSNVIEKMASKALIYLEGDHWHLTSMGHACSVHAR